MFYVHNLKLLFVIYTYYTLLTYYVNIQCFNLIRWFVFEYYYYLFIDGTDEADGNW